MPAMTVRNAPKEEDTKAETAEATKDVPIPDEAAEATKAEDAAEEGTKEEGAPIPAEAAGATRVADTRLEETVADRKEELLEEETVAVSPEETSAFLATNSPDKKIESQHSQKKPGAHRAFFGESTEYTQ
jgi:hypothetical protein